MKSLKPIKPTMNPARALSWSAISSFEYDPEQWYRKYVLNEATPSNPAMEFGNVVGERLRTDPTFLPTVPRYKQFEKKLEGKIGNILLVGYLDTFCPDTKYFHEYKTSSNAKRWTKKTAQEHGQMLFYRLLIWLNYEIPPENIKASLHYIPVEEGADFAMRVSKTPPQSFETSHTTMDILKFGAYIKDVYKRMLQYAEDHS